MQKLFIKNNDASEIDESIPEACPQCSRICEAGGRLWRFGRRCCEMKEQKELYYELKELLVVQECLLAKT